MIGRLGEALQLPLSARNELLALAGFAARYPSRSWEENDMAPIEAALDHLLERHAPFPAMAMDRLWKVERLNGPARLLFGALGIVEGASLLDLMTRGELSSWIENWPEVAHYASLRLRTESLAQGGVAELDKAGQALAAAPGNRERRIGPVAPAIFRYGATRLSLFAIIAHFGTPEDIALDDLKIELFFPADAETEKTLRAMTTDA
jgi:hypothetical protein